MRTSSGGVDALPDQGDLVSVDAGHGALLVDRMEPATQWKLLQRCRALGIGVVVATTFERARALLERQVFDVVVFEPQLDANQGDSFLEELAELDPPPATLIWTSDVASLEPSVLRFPLRHILPKTVDIEGLVGFLQPLTKSPLLHAIDRFSTVHGFSPTHRQIMRALVQVAHGKAVSKSLDKNPDTVRVHLHRMYARAGCDSQASLVAKFWHWFACLRWYGASVPSKPVLRCGALGRVDRDAVSTVSILPIEVG